MLLTRCPGCRTTFRITVQALEAADGQVRCGRCSEVFDAREALSELPAAGEGSELSAAIQPEADVVAGADAGTNADADADADADTDTDTDTDTDATSVTSTDTSSAEAVEAAAEDPLARTDEFHVAANAFAEAAAQAPEPASEHGDAPPEDANGTQHLHDADPDTEPAERSPQKDAQSPFADHSSVASVIAEIRRQQHSGTDEADDDASVAHRDDEGSFADDAVDVGSEADFAAGDADARDDDAMPPEQVDAVLDGTPDSASDTPARPAWLAERTPEKQPSRWWTVAVVATIVALAAQFLHHYRSDLATHPALGHLLSDSYSRLGMEIVPSWDLAQYQIMEWVASAESDEQVSSSLNITARIQNRGPNPQPFPYVHLKLKDRWDMPVGSRVFRPAEYLDAVEAGALMQPGQTARARLRVVDPGEDAYGFELDVCVDAAPGGLRCATDEVFR